MRRTVGFVAVAGLAVVAMAQINGGTLLTNFAKAINTADTLSSNYTVQMIGSAPENYSVVLKKPNLARLDTPQFLVVADGKTVTRYEKATKTWYKQPQTDAELKSLFANDDLGLFYGFFNGDAYKAATVKSLGEKNRKGQLVQAVQANADASGKKTVTYFVGSDGLARAAQFDLNDPQGKVSYVLDTKSFDVNGAVPANAFAFAAPADAREVNLAELSAGKWYTDLQEAMTAAKAGHKKIFVDFMATWCGPCKKLDKEVLQTSEFKKLGAKLIFLKIDVDAQPGVAKRYNIEAMPTQMVLDPNGNVLSKTVGYGDPATFYRWLNSSL
jgi:thiol-disulfide isomerase/thioredoxin